MKIKLQIFYILIIIGIQSDIFPCTIPVFRYAQINWQLDSYNLDIIFSDSLKKEHIRLLDELKAKSYEGDSTININIKYVDINKTFIDKKININNLPILNLYFPRSKRNKSIIWSGKLSKDNLNNIINSPARSELLKYLKSENVAVFLFLESGNEELDKKYYLILEKQLKILSESLSLPDSAFNVNGLPITEVDNHYFKIKFSIVKIPRNNIQEQIFNSILLKTEPDLKYFKSPIIYPVFGRGRMLYGLVGKGINIKNIKYACNSLLQWCSCTIKEENHGNDLLLFSDWQKSFDTIQYISEPIPNLSGLSEFITKDTLQTEYIENMPKTALINIESKDTNKQNISDSDLNVISHSKSLSLKSSIILTLIILFFLVVLITLIIKKRQ